MPRVCTICRHESREAIDQALLAGEPLRNIAKRYGTSPTALHRHKAGDLPKVIVRAKEAGEVLHGEKLLDQVRSLIRKAEGILDRAENDRTALAAIRELRETIMLLGKMTGELQAPPAEVEHRPMFQIAGGASVVVNVIRRSVDPPQAEDRQPMSRLIALEEDSP